MALGDAVVMEFIAGLWLECLIFSVPRYPGSVGVAKSEAVLDAGGVDDLEPIIKIGDRIIDPTCAKSGLLQHFLGSEGFHYNMLCKFCSYYLGYMCSVS